MLCLRFMRKSCSYTTCEKTFSKNKQRPRVWLIYSNVKNFKNEVEIYEELLD